MKAIILLVLVTLAFGLQKSMDTAQPTLEFAQQLCQCPANKPRCNLSPTSWVCCPLGQCVRLPASAYYECEDSSATQC